MLRTRFLVVSMPVLAAAALLWLAQPGSTAPGGSHGSGGHSSGHSGGGGGARSSPGATFRTSPSGTIHVNPGSSSFHHNNGNVFISPGFFPHNRHRFFNYYSLFYYSPNFYSNYYYFSNATDSSLAQPIYIETPGADQGGEPQPPPEDGKAHIMVILPTADAVVWFNGTKTSQTGKMRAFASPELKPGKEYTYAIKARWKVDGKNVEQTRTLIVASDRWQIVDFTRPPEEDIPPPKPADR